MDNLQSTTYQTFEQDPVKYRNYEEASNFVWEITQRLNPPLGYVPGIDELDDQ